MKSLAAMFRANRADFPRLGHTVSETALVYWGSGDRGVFERQNGGLLRWNGMRDIYDCVTINRMYLAKLHFFVAPKSDVAKLEIKTTYLRLTTFFTHV